MANGNKICSTDAFALSASIRAKRLLALEVTDAVLARMGVLDPMLHAFCTPTPKPARAFAKQNEKRIMANEPVGPLAGVPWGCKDMIVPAGVKTVSGSAVYADVVPDKNDIGVERMRDAARSCGARPTFPSSATAVSSTSRCSRPHAVHATPV